MAAHQLVRVIEFGSRQQVQADRVDDHARRTLFYDQVVRLGFRVQFEFILESTASPRQNGDTKCDFRSLLRLGDDLGDPNRQPHLVPNSIPFAENPDFRKSVYTSFDYRVDRPREWWTNVLCMYDGALQLRYEGLDKNAKYKIRFVYSSEPLRKVKVRLEADDQPLHDWMIKPDEMTPMEFDIPPAATADGELHIRWTREPGLGGNGRGCQVAEVFLLRQP